ncbi:glycerol dehydratase reactivase beta/small subunit family protein [Bacillus sp. CECT 9360]|uniref:glycerol dehydratase reactivase beta/small subunit family protein n=1 Tax=Bacillus sp. CECT 9360 TaxID=2845821 RepID=UPI001E583ECA|nr:glycerol dehydratase reactivase beta/small subunit family protein [Bacillus sp. CECT 9360]CAH0345184.1 hypothetical protein BCI9360_01463 [Bacillus sp. CECT 9360]
MNKREIYIPILYHHCHSRGEIEEICAGLEEEGVPFSLLARDRTGSFIELGAEAAAMSPLQVGIGIGEDGNVCVHHEKLNQKEPYLQGSIQSGRGLGKNAARLVKGLPLSL